MTSCLGYRYLEKDEKLISKDPKIIGLSTNQKKEAEKLIIQKSNKRLFGILPISHQVYSYELGLNHYDTAKINEKLALLETKYIAKLTTTGNQKQQQKIRKERNKKTDKLKVQLKEGNWWMRSGEQPAIYEPDLHLLYTERIQSYLFAQGYFDAAVNFTTQFKKQKANITYLTELKEQYWIDSIEYVTADTSIINILQSDEAESFIIKGAPYKQQNIDKERDRIISKLMDNGYYQFNKKYLTFEIDTSLLMPYKVLIKKIISIPSWQKSHKQYNIAEVRFLTNMNTNEPDTLTLPNQDGVHYHFKGNKYNENILNQKIFIAKNQLYSKEKTLITQRQLSLLDTYKFINIQYDSSSNQELIASIFAKPLDKYQTSNEFGFFQDDFSQVLPGPFITLGIKKRNAFGHFETADLNFNFSLLGISNIDSRQQPYSLFEYGGRLSFTFPQFLFPISQRYRKIIAPFNPRTRLSFLYHYENRTKEYERNQIITDFSYLWNNSNERQFIVTPFGFNFTDIRTINDDFQAFLDKQDSLGNGSLSAAFKPSLTTYLSSDFNYNQNDYGNLKTNSYLLHLYGESGGLYINAFNKIIPDSTFTLFQWAKINTDIRGLIILPKGQLAFRFNLGLAYAYGEARSLPYERRFYAGGSNSNRAWPVRRLGPGSYGVTENEKDAANKKVAIINYQREQGGDMIIEANLEYRDNLTKNLDYAFFMDVGNIWILNSDQNIKDWEGDDGKFYFDKFYKELGVGIGMGLRFDFSVVVLRLDGAIQAIDPGQPIGSRYILNKLLSHSGVFRNKSNISIGIGLPF